MDKVLIYWDREGNTLNVWFDKPEKEHICEETGDEVILVKDKRGRVIGFEKLNFKPFALIEAAWQAPRRGRGGVTCVCLQRRVTVLERPRN